MYTLDDKQYYKIANNNFTILSEGSLICYPKFVYDKWEDFDEVKLEEYFYNSYEIFLGRLGKFQNLNRNLTAKEKKELRFMLEALIDAKKNLFDE